MKKDVIFLCKKCRNHYLYVSNFMKNANDIIEMECPVCGEEGYENWILIGLGLYKDVNSERKIFDLTK